MDLVRAGHPATVGHVHRAQSADPKRRDRRPSFMTGIPRWLWVLVASGVLGLTGSEYILYRSQVCSLQRKAEADLRVVAILKSDQISRWRAERLADAAEVFEDPFLTSALTAWLARPSPFEAGRIRQRFRGLMARGDYCEVMLADVQGQVRLCASGLPGAPHAELTRALLLACDERRPVLTDLHASSEDFPLHVDVVVPLFGEGTGAGGPVAVVILQSDPRRFLFPLIKSWPRSSRTAEILLVRREGDEVVFLNELRFQRDPSPRLRLPLSRTEVPAAAAVLGTHGVVYGSDYRGVEVMAVIAPVPETSWHLVAKVDVEEVTSVWRNGGFLLLGLLLAMLVVVLALTGTVWQSQIKTQHHRAQTELRAIYDAAPVMMCVLDAECRVFTANRAFREATGWPDADLADKRAGGVMGCIFSLDDPRGCGFGPHCQACALRLAMVNTLASGAPHQDVEHHTVLARRGRRQEVVILGSTTSFPSVGSPQLLLCLVDISERRRLEEQLQRTERLRAMGQLSAGVSHNLNNILTGVLLPAETLRTMVHQPELQELVATIHAAGSRARDLVHRLHLSVRGVAEEAPTAVSLNATVEEALEVTRPRWKDEPEAHGVGIDLRLDLQEVPPIRGTRSRLHDVVINLLLNAVDAMPAGGCLSVATALDGPFVRLTVQDDGTGMDEEVQSHLFQPFFTTKAELGTGLGLSTVYSTVTHWGGRIEVNSVPGQGATFRIFLPVAEALVDAANPDPTGLGPGRRGCLLVVDDDEMTRSLLARLLRSDHEVTAMDGGETALAGFTSGRYDVAFVDLGMPGTPGDRLARSLREADPNLATVLITGWELSPDDPRRRDFDFLVRKPLSDLDWLAEVTVRAIALHDRRTAGG